MSNGEENFQDVRSLRTYIAPVFRLLFWLTAAVNILLLAAALYFLYSGFLRPLPAEAAAGQGWTQLFSMLLGLLLLFMALVQIIVLLMLLRYRRFVFVPTLSHAPLLTAAIVTLLEAAIFAGLAVAFISTSLLLLIPAAVYLLLGIGWLYCYVKSLRLRRDPAQKADPHD
ncbi:MAG TPA: hypothetical protein GXZ64_02160 [Clostridiaceae bacterium]|nr:hypothetical protein [Clostridiaceae bacterium]